MNILKRWTLGIVSSVDSVVARIENHEALVNSAIADFQKNVGRAQVQLQSVQRDGAALRTRLDEEEKAALTWKRRAVDTKDNEETALECLRRSKVSARKAAVLRDRLNTHMETEAKLTTDLSRLIEGLSELKEQRNLMRTRQTRAKAMAAVRDGQGRMGGDVAEILERWEMHVAEHEIDGGCFDEGVDAFKAAIEEEEELGALHAELDALRREHHDI